MGANNPPTNGELTHAPVAATLAAASVSTRFLDNDPASAALKGAECQNRIIGEPTARVMAPVMAAALAASKESLTEAPS